MKIITKKDVLISAGLLMFSSSAVTNPNHLELFQSEYLIGHSGEIDSKTDTKYPSSEFNNFNDKYTKTTTSSQTYSVVELGYTSLLGAHPLTGMHSDNNDSKESCAYVGKCDLFDIDNDLQSSLLGKINSVIKNRILSYFVNQLSFAHLRLNYRNEMTDSYTKRRFMPGWRVGGELEWSLAPHWSVSGNYFYADYDTFKMSIPTLYQLFDPNEKTHIKINSIAFQASIRYRFS